jgi:hypothetical protein
MEFHENHQARFQRGFLSLAGMLRPCHERGFVDDGLVEVA